ncbi:hypothetical protein [Dokdonella soli]|uniref:Uncharacterized protein n=1 Tax=Dokdonella soli TaxID=529810 RepID=A0ABN1ID82_9GAMM
MIHAPRLLKAIRERNFAKAKARWSTPEAFKKDGDLRFTGLLEYMNKVAEENKALAAGKAPNQVGRDTAPAPPPCCPVPPQTTPF